MTVVKQGCHSPSLGDLECPAPSRVPVSFLIQALLRGEPGLCEPLCPSPTWAAMPCCALLGPSLCPHHGAAL